MEETVQEDGPFARVPNQDRPIRRLVIPSNDLKEVSK